MKPEDLLVRCYARRRSPGHWYAVCIDLNLDAEADSLQNVKRSLDLAINGYLRTVIDGQNQASIAHLIRRPAPIKDRAFYYAAKFLNQVARLHRSYIAFKEAVPIHLAHNCA
jgi:hypothetical protein